LSISELKNHNAHSSIIRYLQTAKHIWNGLDTLYQEQSTEVVNPCVDNEVELSELLPWGPDVEAGFTLRDPEDPRYQKVKKAKMRFGNVICRAASVLQENIGGEDHIDAIFVVARSIEVYLLEYGTTKATYASSRKSYVKAKRSAVVA
jgi:proteasome activator subunit 4